MPASQRQRGFTLIEILVAFMVLTLVLTVVFRIFSGGLRNVELSSDYTRAVLVAESQLTAAGITAPLEIGETSGDCAGAKIADCAVASLFPHKGILLLLVCLLIYSFAFPNHVLHVLRILYENGIIIR